MQPLPGGRQHQRPEEQEGTPSELHGTDEPADHSWPQTHVHCLSCLVHGQLLQQPQETWTAGQDTNAALLGNTLYSG